MIALYLSLVDDEQKNKFEQLYYKYRNLMYYIAFQVLKHERDSEDAVQEALIRIAKNMDKVEKIDDVQTKNFVAIITKREAMKIYNKQKGYEEEYPTAIELMERPNSGNLINEVEWAISQLPYKYSSLLNLKYVFGYSGKEISQITGMSETNVRQQLLRGRKLLEGFIGKVNE